MKTPAVILTGALYAAMILAANPVLSQDATPAFARPESPAAPVFAMGSTMIAASAAVPTALMMDEQYSYFVVKAGGWTLREQDIKNADLGTFGELAFGGKYNRYVGGEFGIGYLATKGDYLQGEAKVSTIPVNISLRLGIPISIVEPYVIAGGGLYITTIDAGPVTNTTARAGYQAGLGVDVNIGSFIVGVEGRYFVISGAVSGTDINLDGYTVAAKAGIRY